jgi:hypothetical protein
VETVEMFKWAGSRMLETGNGEVGIFAYPNAFEYYAGRGAKVLDPLGTEWADSVIFTYDTLDAGVGNGPNLFYYMATSTSQDNTQYAIYKNGDYGLVARVLDGRVDRSDADLIDINRQVRIKTVPFTKIKVLDENLSYSDAKNRVVNVQDIEGSVLAEGLKRAREYSLPGAFVVRG